MATNSDSENDDYDERQGDEVDPVLATSGMAEEQGSEDEEDDEEQAAARAADHEEDDDDDEDDVPAPNKNTNAELTQAPTPEASSASARTS